MMASSEKMKRSRQGLIICVSGPSGVGKNAIIESLLTSRPSIWHSISATTRLPRRGEQDGLDYYFLAKPAFEQMIARDEILEYDIYCDHYYGTPEAPLLAKAKQGLDVVLDITVPGSLLIMQKLPDCVTIFVLPPSFSELERRLIKRGTETVEAMQKRLAKARQEVLLAQRFEYVVVNDDLAETTRQILAIIDAEHCRYRPGIEQDILAL